MCGITGIFNLNGETVEERLVNEMTDTLVHRGPDDSGIFCEKNTGLGHRRLSIIDVSERGKQPMISRNKEWVIVFNGCIYNYKELRSELLEKGAGFISTSDTEVILEGVSLLGIEFLKRLNGMFAIALLNRKENKVYLSRDRYGIKPLYYYFDGTKLVFASEIKALLKHPGIKAELNMEALNEYFTFQNLFTYSTFFRGITLLPQANTVEIGKETKSVKHISWWDYDFTSTDITMTFEEAKSETARLLKQAVIRQMVSDVPVGSYLSGGMDSGSITGIASTVSERLSTFTCGFDMSGVSGIEANYDERRDAELIANYFKTEHFELVMNAGDLRWSLPKVVWHLEDLRMGMSYPNYYISRLASKFVKVCLQGTGGDELFGGYPWRYYRVFDSLSKEDFFENYYTFWQRLVNDRDKHELFTGNVLGQVDLNEPKEIFKRVFTFNTDLKFDSPEEHIQNSLYFEIKTFLHGLLLVGDKLSMANGLEERYPFLDNDLVDFAQKIPVKYKLGNLESEIKKINENEPGAVKKSLSYIRYDDGKNVLRKAMKDFIPEKILARNKQGFSAPDESWYRGENASYVTDILLRGNTVSSEFINRKFIERIIDEHINKKVNHRLLIWSFLNFELWCRKFLM